MWLVKQIMEKLEIYTPIKKIIALLFPLLVAFMLTGFIPAQRQVIDDRLQLKRLTVSSASELNEAFGFLKIIKKIEPEKRELLSESYEKWKMKLTQIQNT